MTIKKSIRKLVDTGVKRTTLPAAKNNPAKPLIVNKALREVPPDPLSAPSGLVDPLIMDVLTTTTVSIPVPVGATSVDVEVIQTFTLTDNNGAGNVYNVTVNAYP
jgi:hypothetical protein